MRGARRKALSGLEGLLESVALEMMMISRPIRAGMHLMSWRDRVLDFRSCLKMG